MKLRSPKIPIIGALALLLAACSAPGDGPQPPTLPAGAPLALVGPGASSAFHEQLQERVRTDTHDGSEEIGDYELLILDGDAQSPQELAEHELLQQALETGTWVLVLDASYEHKKTGLFPHLKMATEGDSEAFLFRKVTGAAGPTFEIGELNLDPPLVSDDPAEEGTPAPLNEESKTYARAAFAKRLTEKLESDATCESPLELPQNARYAVWCYELSKSFSLKEITSQYPAVRRVEAGDKFAGHVVQPQKGYHRTDFVFTLLLSNADKPAGDYQLLHLQTDGTATPTTSTFPTDVKSIIAGKPYLMGWWQFYWRGNRFPDHNYVVPNGWLQSSMALAIDPQKSGLWELVQFQPGSRDGNNNSSYRFTASNPFRFSYNPKAATGAGNSGSETITVSYKKDWTYTTPDWSWSESDLATWKFSSLHPRVGNYRKFMPFRLNDINRGKSPLRYGTSALWSTCPGGDCQLVTSTRHLQLKSSQTLLSLSCAHGARNSKSNGCFPRAQYHPTAQTTIALDMSTVLPPKVFPDFFGVYDRGEVTEANPARPGDIVSGQIESNKVEPSYYPYLIGISTDNDQVTVPKTVKATDDLAIFDIKTKADTPLTKANITVTSYGTSLTTPLWIVPEDNFGKAVAYKVGKRPNDLASADFNGDGNLDLVTANSGDSKTKGNSILLGQGDGSFILGRSLTSGPSPHSVTTGDVNGDGFVDIVTAYGQGSEKGLYTNLGNGDGSFRQTGKHQPFNGQSAPVAIVTADFDGDGNLDLATANQAGDSVSILLGNGDGSFEPHILIEVGQEPAALASADFNGDHIPDLVTANAGGSNHNGNSILLGKGDGSFTLAQTTASGASPHAVATGNVTADNDTDIITAFGTTKANNGVFTNLGNGDGTFRQTGTPQPFVSDGIPAAIASGDLSGDGKPDVLTVNRNSQTASLLVGKGDGSFEPRTLIPTGAKQPSAVVIADLGGDNKLDIALADKGSGSVKVLINQ